MKNRHDQILFWGCFIAIITTSYAFISRMILCGGQFVTDFGLDKVSVGTGCDAAALVEQPKTVWNLQFI